MLLPTVVAYGEYGSASGLTRSMAPCTLLWTIVCTRYSMSFQNRCNPGMPKTVHARLAMKLSNRLFPYCCTQASHPVPTCWVVALLHERAQLAATLGAVAQLRLRHSICCCLACCAGPAPALATRVDLCCCQACICVIHEVAGLQGSPGEADLALLAGCVLAHAQSDTLSNAAPARAPLLVEVGFVAEVVDGVGAVLAYVEAVARRDGCTAQHRAACHSTAHACQHSILKQPSNPAPVCG